MTKKTTLTLLLILIMMPLIANYKLHQIIENHSSLRSETLSNEVSSILEQKTGIKITKHAIVSQLSEFCEIIIYSSPEEEPDEPIEYAFTIPYHSDDAVLIMRRGEDIDILKEIYTESGSKIYAGYEEDTIFRNWLTDANFFNINNDSKTIADALELIIDKKADFTLLPNHMAQKIIQEAGLTYALTTSRTLFPIEYRIPVEPDDTETLVKLNDTLLKLEADGTLTNIYIKEGIKSNVVIEQETKILQPVIFNVLILLFLVLSIVYFIKYYSKYKKSLSKTDDSNEENENIEIHTMSLNDKISILTNKNSSISAKITENQNTDPYSGFYNTNFLNRSINDCFVSYAKKGIPFSIAVIDTSRRIGPTADIMKNIKEEISQLLIKTNTKLIAAHNGFGIFYILFPNAEQDGALYLINKANCQFNNFSLTEYKGQDQFEFLGGLGL